jgi:hypothetical protein
MREKFGWTRLPTMSDVSLAPISSPYFETTYTTPPQPSHESYRHPGFRAATLAMRSTKSGVTAIRISEQAHITTHAP